MNTEPVKIIPFTQATTERDHWFVDVCTGNDNSIEVKWIEADEQRKTASHWMIIVFAANPYKLPGLIDQALNLLEHKKGSKY
ncbi:MAG: hypothetical protein HFE92_01250 [Acutalibacter muris]|nr:hypothetical protein [Acutalibacter muris]